MLGLMPQAIAAKAMWKTVGMIVMMVMVLVVFGGLIYGCVYVENSVGARIELASIRQGSKVTKQTIQAQQEVRDDMREAERNYRTTLADKDREIAQLRASADPDVGDCEIGCTLPEELR